MTYITRIATKRILAKYFIYSLQINYLHWKLSASRSIFSCYATFLHHFIFTVFRGDSFRKAYAHLRDIRSLLPSGVNVMALTATATSDTYKIVC